MRGKGWEMLKTAAGDSAPAFHHSSITAPLGLSPNKAQHKWSQQPQGKPGLFLKLPFSPKGVTKLLRSCSSVKYLLHKNDQGFPVVLPFFRQLALMGIFVTAHVDGQLKAVCVQVAEVIYACQRGGIKKKRNNFIYLFI